MIKFGTDGWRAIIAKDFTCENVRITAQAIADYILSEGRAEEGLVIGYDSRFMSNYFAEECARVTTANGIKTFLSNKIAATPVISFAVKDMQTAGAIMITASHNPSHWNGVKFKADYAGSALPDIIAAIEGYLYKNEPKVLDLQPAEEQGLLALFDPDLAYIRHIRDFLDFDLLRKADFKVVIDPMHGAGSGYVKNLLAETGIEVIEIRGDYNPGFGGVNPEPILKNLGALAEAVRKYGALAGFATDGDADRVGAVTENGEFVNSHQIYVLLLRYLVEHKKWQGGVVKTFSTTTMVDKLVEKYGLSSFETPIGFKYICELFLKEDILIGGEESGGIGFKNHIPERDGILCTIFLLKMMALYKKSLKEMINDLMEENGYHYYERIDLPIKGIDRNELTRRLKSPRTSLGGLPLEKIREFDGIKYVFENGAWILFRFSGTEPIVRIYAEADTPEKVKSLLEEGKALCLLK